MGDQMNIEFHSASGKIQSFTNALGKQTTFTYSEQSQTFTNPANSEEVAFTFYTLTKIDHPDGTNEQFGYDGKGNITSYTDQAGQVWSYTCNSQGQVLTSTNNPAGGVVTNTYKAETGLLAGVSDSLTNAEISFVYDNDQRLSGFNRKNGVNATFTFVG